MNPNSQSTQYEYVGFWPRVGANIIDAIILIVLTLPPVLLIYGESYFETTGLIAGPADFIFSWVLPAVFIIWFWLYKQSTPGHLAIASSIVDAKTGGPMSAQQASIRYAGVWLSAMALGLGYIWVVFDPRKQGWHDKMAGTVVVRPVNRGPQPVVFQP